MKMVQTNEFEHKIMKSNIYSIRYKAHKNIIFIHKHVFKLNYTYVVQKQ